MTTTAAPSDIRFRQQSQCLEVVFDDAKYSLSAEYLRVYSPSAEVRGHGGGPLQLVPEKKDVKIISIKPVGHYAIQITFDDGHDSGLYTWGTLRELGEQQEKLWQDYLTRLDQAGESRATKTKSAPIANAKFKKVT